MIGIRKTTRKATSIVGAVAAAALVLAAGCAGQSVSEPVFPKAPPDYPMYDTAHLNDESGWQISNTHDPSIIKTDQGYYVFSTDVKVGGQARPGIMVRKSPDLIHWSWVGYALDGVPNEAEEWSHATEIWAPDVTKMGGKYFLYYAASTFGSNRSYIGLETSDSIEGPWHDEGSVVKSKPGDPPNAIDPNPVTDAQGNHWLVYGSFFDGIYVLPLNESGKPKQSGFGTRIAARDPMMKQGAVEGPYIIYNPQFKKYYLFASYDSLFGTYNVRVGRSDSITGPYLDANGHDMADTSIKLSDVTGTKILGGYRFSDGDGWIAPGGGSVLKDGGNYYIVHHARGEKNKDWPYLHVRKLLWTSDGWPVVSPERYNGETVQKIPKRLIAGKWERIMQDPKVYGQADAAPLSLLSDGTFTSNGKQAGKWTFDGDHTLTLDWAGASGQSPGKETVLVLPAWNWEANKPALVFTGMNGQGIAVWGKQLAAGSHNNR